MPVGFILVGQDDLSAFGGETAGSRSADAFGRSSDDGCFSLQFHSPSHCVLLYSENFFPYTPSGIPDKRGSSTKILKPLPQDSPALPSSIYVIYARLCYSMWLFHLHSTVKIQPFSPVFPLAESLAKAFCRLFLWNFKGKSIRHFLGRVVLYVSI